MGSKRKPHEKCDTNEIAVADETDEDNALAAAQMLLRRTLQAAATLKQCGGLLHDHVEMMELAEALRRQADTILDGDLGRGEAMLAARLVTFETSPFLQNLQHLVEALYVHLVDRAH